MYSVLGVLQKQSKNSNINVSDLSNGIYLVKITTHDNKTVTERVIIK